MQSIDFNSYDHNFCESSIYSNTQHPEYLNSLSSLFITFIGINAIRKPNNNLLLQMLYSSFILNGITSCFYHYYNTIGWGLLDRMSMILIAFSSIYLFIYNIRIVGIWKGIIIKIIVITYFTIFFTIAGLHMETLFNIMFGIFLGSLILFITYYSKNITKYKIPYKLINFGWKGIMYIAISGIFWIVTENLCHNYFFIKYLFGHVWWHFFVSSGGYLISLIPCYIYLQRTRINTIQIEYDIFHIPYISVYDKSHYSYNMV